MNTATLAFLLFLGHIACMQCIEAVC